jgi:hypothetical protein
MARSRGKCGFGDTFARDCAFNMFKSFHFRWRCDRLLPSDLYVAHPAGPGIMPGRANQRRYERQEYYMSKTLKSVLALGFIAVVAACAQPAEEEFVVVEPVTVEPVQTGKYK